MVGGEMKVPGGVQFCLLFSLNWRTTSSFDRAYNLNSNLAFRLIAN